MDQAQAPVIIPDGICPLSQIKVPEGRARKEFTGIEDLARSIIKFGLIQPIVVDDKFTLIAGERRFRACSLIPALVLTLPENERPLPEHRAFPITKGQVPFRFFSHTDELERREIELEENLRREKLSVLDEMFLMKTIHELKVKKYGSRSERPESGEVPDPEQRWSVEKTAALRGVSRADAQNKINTAKKLEARPDLVALFKAANMPLNKIMQQLEHIEQIDAVKKKQAEGKLTLSSALKKGDALELVKQQGSNSVDLILTDPPFGIPELTEAQGKARGSAVSYTGLLKSTDNLTKEQACALIEVLAPEMFRVLKPGRHLYLFFGFDCYECSYQALAKAGFLVDRVPLIWFKERSTSPAYGFRYPPSYEPILFAVKPNGEGEKGRSLQAVDNVPMRNVISCPIVQSGEKLHPFQKPLDLLATLIKRSTYEGETVLDLFAGSASTLVAALDCGRSGLGFELDEERFMMGQKQLTEREKLSEGTK